MFQKAMWENHVRKGLIRVYEMFAQKKTKRIVSLAFAMIEREYRQLNLQNGSLWNILLPKIVQRFEKEKGSKFFET